MAIAIFVNTNTFVAYSAFIRRRSRFQNLCAGQGKGSPLTFPQVLENAGLKSIVSFSTIYGTSDSGCGDARWGVCVNLPPFPWKAWHAAQELLDSFGRGLLAATALSAGSTPPPPPTPSPSMNSGTEGTKAALVRLELLAASEIAHIDHSSGEVVISRGKSSVPLGSGTGVVVSAEGIVATTWENLAVNEGAVAVYTANELFSKVIGVPIVGNDGNMARRGSTPDQHWGPHLQHCYDLVEHCVLFRVPQYRVRTYTSQPGSVMAELLNTPTGAQDVALLRISGGGGAPTAILAPPDKQAGGESLLLGFTEQPTPAAGPAALPVTVDAAAGKISPRQDLSALLKAGVSGGPVIDSATGQVLGLAGPLQPNGQATLTSASAIQAAMAAAGVKASPSKFDAVFRRGIDHLSSGNSGSAESAFEESLTYYDSALATSHLEHARAMKNQQPPDQSATATADGETPGNSTANLLVGAAVLLLAGIIAAATVRHRKRTQPEVGGRPSSVRRPQHSGRGTAPGANPGRRTPSQEEPTVMAASVETKRRQDNMPPEGPDRGAEVSHSVQTATGKTRTAGRLVKARTREGNGEAQATAFCPQCGRTVPPGARYCSGCGQLVG